MNFKFLFLFILLFIAACIRYPTYSSLKDQNKVLTSQNNSLKASLDSARAVMDIAREKSDSIAIVVAYNEKIVKKMMDRQWRIIDSLRNEIERLRAH